jgi:hypothetical protein
LKKSVIITFAAISVLIVLATWAFLSIFDQQLTRKWGFATKIHLEAGQKFIGYDWLDDNVWTASRPMRPGELPETITINEHSRFGQLEGSVIVIETAK